MSLISRAPVIGSSLGLLSRQDQQKEIRPPLCQHVLRFQDGSQPFDQISQVEEGRVPLILDGPRTAR